MDWIYKEYQLDWNLVTSTKAKLVLCDDNPRQILEDLEIAIQSNRWASASHRFSDSDTLIARKGTKFEYWLDDGFLGHILSREEFLGYVEAALIVENEGQSH